MLEINNLHAEVGGRPILKGLSFAIGAGGAMLAAAVPANATPSYNVELPFFLIYNGCAGDPTTESVEERLTACRKYLADWRPKFTGAIASKDAKSRARADAALDRTIQSIDKSARRAANWKKRPYYAPLSTYARCLGESVLRQDTYAAKGWYEHKQVLAACAETSEKLIQSMPTKSIASSLRREINNYQDYVTNSSMFSGEIGGKLEAGVDTFSSGPIQP